jgi:hypothetical protein
MFIICRSPLFRSFDHIESFHTNLFSYFIKTEAETSARSCIFKPADTVLLKGRFWTTSVLDGRQNSGKKKVQFQKN